MTQYSQESIYTSTNGRIPTLNPSQLVKSFSQKDKYWDKPIFRDFDTFGFHKIEETRHLMNHHLPPHRKTFHDFFFVTQGSLCRGKGMETYQVKPNTFCFIPAHQITHGAIGSNDLEGVMCHFDQQVIHLDHHPFLSELDFLQFNGYPLIKVPDNHLPVIKLLLARIEDEFQQNLPDKYKLIQSYLITLFLELGRFSTPQKMLLSPAHTIITEKFKKLLHLHIQEKQQLADYASMLSITPNHLNKCMKQATNRTATDWLNEMLLLESKVLLSQTNFSVAEIAFKVGMEDPSYFGRFFKKKTGCTPRDYRKMVGNTA